MGYGWPMMKQEDALSKTPPTSMKEAEDRVHWVLTNFIKGEKYLLYRLLHNTESIRLDSCDYEVAKMRKALGGKP